MSVNTWLCLIEVRFSFFFFIDPSVIKSEPLQKESKAEGEMCAKEFVYLSFLSLVFNSFIIQVYNLLRTIDELF